MVRYNACITYLVSTQINQSRKLMINPAFWLSWVSLACTIVAAIGGVVGYSVSCLHICVP